MSAAVLVASPHPSPLRMSPASSLSGSPVPPRERPGPSASRSSSEALPRQVLVHPPVTTSVQRKQSARRRKLSAGHAAAALAPLTSLVTAHVKADARQGRLTSSPVPLTPPDSPKPTPAAPKQRLPSPDAPAVKLSVELVSCRDLNVHSTSPAALFVLLAVNSTVSRSGSPIRYDAPSELLGTPDGVAGVLVRNRLNPVFDHTAQWDVPGDDSAELFISVYDRYDGDSTHASGLVGTASIKLEPSRRESDRQLTLELFDREGGRVDGTVQLRVVREVAQRKKLTPTDFEIIRRIGEGSYGRVYKVRKLDTGRIYAMKVLSKDNVRSSGTRGHVGDERKVLERARSLNSPFLVGLKFSFQTETHLYLVMDYKSGGELFKHLQKEGGHFVEDRVRFYLAEIVLGMEALHSRHALYRDLKPENILLDETGHLALCDFGLSKPLEPNQPVRSNTFCGTSDYISPEMIKDEGASYAADWWALGVLAYEMAFGYTPFYHENKLEKFQLIVKGTIRIPRRGISPEFREMLIALLERDPDKRLGFKGADEIKRHSFFASMDWTALANRRLEPPFKPESESDTPALSAASSPSELAVPAAPAPERIRTEGPTNMSRRSSCEVPRAPGAELDTPDEPHDWSSFSFYATERGSGSYTASVHSISSAHGARRSSFGRFLASARQKLTMTSA